MLEHCSIPLYYSMQNNISMPVCLVKIRYASKVTVRPFSHQMVSHPFSMGNGPRLSVSASGSPKSCVRDSSYICHRNDLSYAD